MIRSFELLNDKTCQTSWKEKEDFERMKQESREIKQMVMGDAVWRGEYAIFGGVY